MLALNGVAYAAWFGGTVAGYLVGAVLPAAIQSSLGIGLYALFAAILVPEIKKRPVALLVALLAGLAYLLLSRLGLLSSGWSLIAAIIAAAAAGLFVRQDEEREGDA